MELHTHWRTRCVLIVKSKPRLLGIKTIFATEKRKKTAAVYSLSERRKHKRSKEGFMFLS